MVKTSLVESDIAQGQQLIEALKSVRNHFNVQAAFWLNKPEVMEWRLYIATPLVDQRGPFSTYTDVQNILRTGPQKSTLSIQEISLVSPNDRLVQVMKGTVAVPRGLPGVRIGRTRVADTYIEDAYVYRV